MSTEFNSAKKYVRKVPQIIEAEQITEQSYDGYVTVCAHCLEHLIFIDERREEEKYKGSQFRCEWEDDGHCLKSGHKKCEHARKIGYIKLKDYKYVYPMIGDYMVMENGKISFFNSKEFEENFISI